ncbi:MAG: hypothetical protein ACRDJT_09435 [Actinomycetota bacterium]
MFDPTNDAAKGTIFEPEPEVFGYDAGGEPFSAGSILVKMLIRSGFESGEIEAILGRDPELERIGFYEA